MDLVGKLRAWRRGQATLIIGSVLAIVLPAPANQKDTKAADQLFSGGQVLHVEIEIAPEQIEILERQRRRQFGSQRTNVPATVREAGITYDDVLVHLKGSAGSFRTIDLKPGFTLSFGKREGGPPFHGLSKFSLNNSVQDASYLCEQISREMFHDAGIPVPRVTHATVTLNGRNLGMYVLAEAWSRQFLKKHFDDVTGNLYEPVLGVDLPDYFEVKSGDNPENREMLDLLTAATQENPGDRLAAIDRVLDLDRFLTFFAMEVMLAHWDGYALNKNNYRIFHDRAANKLLFLPHGMDQMFGVKRSTPYAGLLPHPRGRLAAAILETEEGRRRYLGRMGELFTNIFHATAISNRVREVAATLRPELTATKTGASDPPPPSRRRRLSDNGDNGSDLWRFTQAVDQLQTRIAERAASVREQLMEYTRPVQFGQAGAVNLTEWEWRKEYGSARFYKRRVDGGEILEMESTGSASHGSWRTMLLLSPGKYQFHGLGKIEQGLRGKTTDGLICLKTSEGSASTTVTNLNLWLALTNHFVVQSTKYVELTCEVKANRGKAHFDADSLKLRQISFADKSH
jgi:hypothetical protein